MTASDPQAKVAVTGAAGFVGQALVSALRAAGRRYRAIVRAAPGKSDANVHAVGDLAAADDDALARALDGVTTLVHLAGRAHVVKEKDAATAAEAHRLANAVATERLAKAAVRAGVAHFMFLSTIKVHGEASESGRPFRADDPLKPEDDYARSKRDAEMALTAAAAGTPMACTILRPPLVYGPQVRGNFLALWQAVDRGLPLPLSRIDNRRQLLYVGNLVHALVQLAHQADAAGAWLVADAEALSTPELVRRIAAVLARPARLVPMPGPLLVAAAAFAGRRAMVARVRGSLELDVAPLVERIGPLPFTLDQGLAITARWWRTRTT